MDGFSFAMGSITRFRCKGSGWHIDAETHASVVTIGHLLAEMFLSIDLPVVLADRNLIWIEPLDSNITDLESFAT